MPGWGKKAEAETPLTETLLPARNGDVVEFDELWSFVGSKAGQCWLWLALCRRTRQVVAYALGDRTEATCRVLWSRLPRAYRYRRSFSDFWRAYQNVLPARTHHPVSKESGQTNHVERLNNTLNTLRQRLGCLVRKTLSFSKCPVWHEVRVKLFLLRYNRQKRDAYLKLNPAEA